MLITSFWSSMKVNTMSRVLRVILRSRSVVKLSLCEQFKGVLVLINLQMFSYLRHYQLNLQILPRDLVEIVPLLSLLSISPITKVRLLFSLHSQNAQYLEYLIHAYRAHVAILRNVVEMLLGHDIVDFHIFRICSIYLDHVVYTTNTELVFHPSLEKKPHTIIFLCHDTNIRVSSDF